MDLSLRTPVSVTFSAWRGIFLRVALDSLPAERAAWFWLLLEPSLHIGFLAFMMAVIRLRAIGGIDVMLWIVVGLLSFFLFRRTAIQTMYGEGCNRALFAYRQESSLVPH